MTWLTFLELDVLFLLVTCNRNGTMNLLQERRNMQTNVLEDTEC